MSSFNPLGVVMNADGKWRKFGGSNGIFQNAFNPMKLGGLFEKKTEAKPDEKEAVQAPSVREGEQADDDPERLKRVGRAQLVSSSSRGVLTEADTSNRKLFGV